MPYLPRTLAVGILTLVSLAATASEGTRGEPGGRAQAQLRLRQMMDETAALLRIPGVPLTAESCGQAVERLGEVLGSWPDAARDPALAGADRARLEDSEALTRVYLKSFELYCESLRIEAGATAGRARDRARFCAEAPGETETLAEDYLRYEGSKGRPIDRSEWGGPAYLQYAVLKAHLTLFCE